MVGPRNPAVVGALLVVFVMTGCSAPAPAASPASATPTSRPSFPAVPGRVLDESQGDGVWQVRLRVGDAEAGYRAARQRLLDGGYQLTKDREGTGGGDGQACIPRLCVGFSATEDPGSGLQSVAYEVFHPVGITTDG